MPRPAGHELGRECLAEPRKKLDLQIHIIIELPAPERVGLEQMPERALVVTKLPIDCAERKIKADPLVDTDPLGLLQHSLHHCNLRISGGKILCLGKKHPVLWIARIDLKGSFGCRNRVIDAPKDETERGLLRQRTDMVCIDCQRRIVARDAFVMTAQLPQGEAAIAMRLHGIRAAVRWPGRCIRRSPPSV